MKLGPCTFALKGPNLTEFSKTFFSSSAHVGESYVKQEALYQNCKFHEKKQFARKRSFTPKVALYHYEEVNAYIGTNSA